MYVILFTYYSGNNINYTDRYLINSIKFVVLHVNLRIRKSPLFLTVINEVEC